MARGRLDCGSGGPVGGDASGRRRVDISGHMHTRVPLSSATHVVRADVNQARPLYIFISVFPRTLRHVLSWLHFTDGDSVVVAPPKV